MTTVMSELLVFQEYIFISLCQEYNYSYCALTILKQVEMRISNNEYGGGKDCRDSNKMSRKLYLEKFRACNGYLLG